MKTILILFFMFSALLVSGQNEFTATAFYKDFQKIYNDAQSGFLALKGEKRENESEGIVTEYNVKILLPLADSGKIVIPHSGLPFVVYYFEPDKLRLKVDQRSVNLRDAVFDALGKKLVTRTETILIDNYPLTSSWYFFEPTETRLAFAAFKLSIYCQNELFYLSFEIRGKIQ